MTPIEAAGYSIVFNTEGYNNLAGYLNQSRYSQIYIVVDTNTHEHCLASFLGLLATALPIEILEIPAGEAHKTIATCTQVWEALADLQADRNAVILNLGGGVVTDLGGFIACTYKRGIDFINVPTTLLSMVDASVGGKTGVDLGTLKNLVGVIKNPQMVLVDTSFLATLSPREMRSGLAEVFKHGLIADKTYWSKLKNLESLTTNDLNEIIRESITIKNNVVLEDPREQGLRKTLNFGHTLGHAIESYCLESTTRETLLHGEAIAIGMILESFLSNKVGTLPEAELQEIASTLISMYGIHAFAKAEITQIIDLMKYDKKNEKGTVQYVLLEHIGRCSINKTAPTELVHQAFDFYSELEKPL